MSNLLMKFAANLVVFLIGFVVFFALSPSGVFAWSYPFGSLYDGSFFTTGPKWLPTKIRSSQQTSTARIYYPFGSLLEGTFFTSGPNWLPTKVQSSRKADYASANKYRAKATSNYQNVPQAQSGQVLGASEPNFLQRIFSWVGGAIVGLADAIWPFDAQEKSTVAQVPPQATKPVAKASPSPSPASLTELAPTGEVTVVPAEDSAQVSVAVPDTIVNPNLTIAGNLTVGGNLTFGDSTDDRLVLKGLLEDDIHLSKSKTYDLGNSGERFKSGYFSDNIYIGDENRLGSDGMNVKGSMYLNTRSGGSIYLDADSGTVYLGAGTNTFSNADSEALTIDPTGSNRVQFHSSANFIDASGNMTIAGTLSSTGGATSSDSVDITPSTNIDALDITGTNITTADLIDLDATATTTGDAVDINMANTRTSGSAILITDASVAATVTGDLIQINVTGTPDTNTIDLDYTAGFSGNAIDITTATAASSGNMIDLNFGAVADTGDAVNIALGATAVAAQALVVSATGASSTDGWVLAADNTGDGIWTGDMINFRTGTGDASGDIIDITMEAGATDAQAFVVANAAASDQAGWLMKVDTTGIFTTNMFDIDLGAQLSTGDIMNVSMGSTNVGGGVLVVADAGGARTDALIDVTSASTGDGTDASALLQLNATGLLLSGSNILDINRSAGAASNVIDITTSTTASAGNLVDLNFGAILDTGDAINIAVGSTAVGAQALVVTDSTIKTADLISITADGATVATGVDALSIAMTTGDGTDPTNSALNIAITPGGTAATDIMNAINIANITDAGTTNGVRIGSGFDNDIDFIDTTAVISVGADGSADQLDINAETTIHLDGAAVTTEALCGNQGDGDIADATNILISDCSGAPTSDYAELYPTKGDVEYGDVVATSTEMVQTKKVVNDRVVEGELVSMSKLEKSSRPYQSNVVGVASNNYGDFTSTGHGLVPEADHPLPVALSGRVSVKVTGEGGAIAQGDYLTTSSTPGYAMRSTKAGPVLGMALESFSGQSGTVLVFVRNGWYDPVEEQKRAVLATLGVATGSVLGASTPTTDSTSSLQAGSGSIGSADGVTASTYATPSLVGPAPDGSLGVLAEEVDLLVHGLLTATNLRVTTAAEFEGTLVVKGLATFEGDLVVKGAFSTGSLDLSGALTKTMTAASDLSAGDPVVVTGANTVARAGGSSANVVGLAASGAGAGSSVRVAIAGTVGGYSGLAVGSRYYVGGGGVVTTSPGSGSATHVGIAVSSSELIVQIFATQVPKEEPAVVDTATVDTGPTVAVVDSGVAPEPSQPQPSASPEASPSPTPAASPELSAQPSPVASPSPSPTP